MSTLKLDKITGLTGNAGDSAPITLSGDTATLGTGATLGIGATIGSGVTIPAAGITGTLGSGVTIPAESGSSLIHVGTTTIATPNVDDSVVFAPTSNFDTFYITFCNVLPVSDGNGIRMSLSRNNFTDVVSLSHSRYYGRIDATRSMANESSSDNEGYYRVVGAGNMSNVAGETGGGFIWVTGCGAGMRKNIHSIITFIHADTNSYVQGADGISYDTAAANIAQVTHIKFALTSGNFSTGTFSVYGLKTS